MIFEVNGLIKSQCKLFLVNFELLSANIVLVKRTNKEAMYHGIELSIYLAVATLVLQQANSMGME